jgi:hypothetical protein
MSLEQVEQVVEALEGIFQRRQAPADPMGSHGDPSSALVTQAD